MAEKHPTWTRSRVDRNRVRWVAYDNRVGTEDCQVLAQGYAESLPAADSAARSALATLGIYQARRMSSGSFSTARSDREKTKRPTDSARAAKPAPRQYLYSRRPGDQDQEFFPAAHLILKKTPRRVYVTRRSFGPDQIGTEDERWSDNEPSLALDRIKLERDGSVYAAGNRTSDFYTTLEAATGDAGLPSRAVFQILGIRPPASLDDIKAAYRRRALEAHPDRGGNPGEFQEVEAAYRQLVREAQAGNA